MADSSPSLQIFEAAAEWYRRRETGDVDAAAFEAWLDADPRHADALIDVESVASLTGSEFAREFTPAWPEALISAPRRSLGDPRRANASAASPRRGLLVGLVASAAALVIGLGWWTAGLKSFAFQTDTGQQLTQNLSDGTRLTLDAGSRLEARYSRLGRDIDLVEGRAFFEVAHDGRPFTVNAGDATVTATGTAFEVINGADGVEVRLAEGGVRVEAAGRTVATLRPGQAIALADGKTPVVSPVRDMDRELSWRKGTIYFEDTPLAEVIQRVNSYSRKRVVIGDKALADLRVTAGFKVGQTDAFLSALKTYYFIRIIETEDEISLHYPRRRS